MEKNLLRKFGNVEVCLSKVKNLQCTDCNSIVKRLHPRFFLEYILNTSCLKKNILRKKSMVDQRFNKGVVHICQFYQKTALMLDPSAEALKILMYSQEDILRGEFFSVKLQV